MKFRFKSERNLLKKLGKQDAIVEFIELSVRHFLSQKPDGENINTYIERLSEKYLIKVNGVDDKFRHIIARNYIVQAYSYFEEFLNSYLDDYNDLYGCEYKLSDSNDDKLSKLYMKLFNKSDANEKIGEFRIEVIQYYRLIRNASVHLNIPKKKMDDKYKSLLAFKNQIAEEYGSSLSNVSHFDDIGFNDFILFTRNIKDIARKLSMMADPANDSIYVDYFERKNLFKELNENRNRKMNALKGHMKDSFGFYEEKVIFKLFE